MQSESIFSSDGSFFHHAYLINGENETVKNALLDLIQKEKRIDAKGNADFVHFVYPSLGVDESRAIRAAQLKMPMNGAYNFFFISFQTATFEAQNSLLKVFEDPSGHNIFFLITPNDQMLLPTLQSRLHLVRPESQEIETHSLAKKFLRASNAERIAFVKDVVERKDKKEVLNFLSSIEQSLHTHWKKGAHSKEMTSALKEITTVRDFVQDRASSIKLLLEHISLVIPRMA